MRRWLALWAIGLLSQATGFSSGGLGRTGLSHIRAVTLRGALLRPGFRRQRGVTFLEPPLSTTTRDDSGGEPQSDGEPAWWTESGGPEEDQAPPATSEAQDQLAGFPAAEQAGELEGVDPDERRRWSEQDFLGSEWKVGIQWENSNDVQVTWIRCKEDFKVDWGINAEGESRPPESGL